MLGIFLCLFLGGIMKMSIKNTFMRYILTNVIGMLGLSCYILADTFFVSKGLGVQGLTALNLSISIYSFINATGLLIGIGGATKYSIYQISITKQILFLPTPLKLGFSWEYFFY